MNPQTLYRLDLDLALPILCGILVYLAAKRLYGFAWSFAVLVIAQLVLHVLNPLSVTYALHHPALVGNGLAALDLLQLVAFSVCAFQLSRLADRQR